MVMNDLLPRIYAVGAIRVSTEKQGRDGDSPDDQHKVIDRFSLSRNTTTAKTRKTRSNTSLSSQLTALPVAVHESTKT